MWYYNYYIAILIISIIYFIISYQKLNILLAIIIIIIISYFYYYKIKDYDDNNKKNFKNTISSINKDITYRQYLHNNNYYLKKFPKEIKYFHKDNNLLNIVLNIRFIKLYDKEKYSNIILYIDKFYKIYMYILIDRYDITKYFNIFIDLRTTIIRELYSMYIILPMKMKFYYGFNSFTELKKSINDFMEYSNKLITIIKRYGYQEKKLHYLDDIKYKPYDNKTKYDVF
jgi:hypothetical protein